MALAESALDVWYQPQAEARTGKVVGVEALLRWRHPVFGPVTPDEVIALAEQTGLIPDITEYVLRTALNQRAHGPPTGSTSTSRSTCPRRI